MRPAGDNRILEIVGVLISLASKIEPRMRELVDKERRGNGNVTIALVDQVRAVYSLPASSRNGLGRGTHCQQVEHHQFTIRIPAARTEPQLRRPMHRKS